MRSDKIKMVIVLFLILTIVQVLYLQYRVGEYITYADSSTELNAFASGTASICINHLPEINNTCNLTIPWGYPYSCTIEGYDTDTGQTLTFDSVFLTSTDLFNVTSVGLIDFIPNISMVGNHTLRIIISDNTGCSNQVNYNDTNVEVVLANHAPYLETLIPNRSLTRYTSFTFYLDDYFVDPDDDILNYTLIDIQTDNVTITMGNNSYINILANDCGVATFSFIAEDPFGLTNTSNTIRYAITGCPTSTPDTGSGGGGGGGGGGYDYDCIPEWKCGRYSACLPNGTSELKCTDIYGCDARDYIKYFYKNCTYVPPIVTCQENWNCTGWSTCIDSKHKRICTDSNSCGTTFSKPAETEQCSPIPSCFNGIKDGDETEIDCGGSCGTCKITEQPVTIQDKKISPAIYIAALLTLAFLGLMIYTFRSNIAKLLATLKYQKPIRPFYFKDDQKKKLIQMQYLMQQRFEEENYLAVNTQIPLFITQYFRELLGVMHIDRDVLVKKLDLLKNKSIEPILLGFYSAYHKYSEEINAIKIQSSLDELLSNIFLISQLKDKDALVMDKERTNETKTPQEECYQIISNLYIAIEFNEIIVAKNLYTQLLEKYESLSPVQRKEIYIQTVRVYNMLNYMLQY